MQTGSFAQASGRVEIDETFVGGKDKTAVMGILERGGKARMRGVANRKNALVPQAAVTENVALGAEIFTMP